MKRKKDSNNLINLLAYYPVTFYIGLIVGGVVIFLSVLHFLFGWEFSFKSIASAIEANQTILLLILGLILGSTLIASAVAYKKICNLSKEEYLLWLQQRSTRTLFPIFTPLHDWFRLRITIYNWWHTKVYSSTIHVIILIVVVLSLGNSVLVQRNILISQSSSFGLGSSTGSSTGTSSGSSTGGSIGGTNGTGTSTSTDSDVDTGGGTTTGTGVKSAPVAPISPVEETPIAVPAPSGGVEVVIKPKVVSFRIYIDSSSQLKGEKWMVYIYGLDDNGNTVTGDSSTYITIRSTTLPITFYTSRSYTSQTETYQLNAGVVTGFAVANAAGTTRLKVTDRTGIIAYSTVVTVTELIAENIESPSEPPSTATDITDDVVTRRVNPTTVPAAPVAEVGSIEILNEQPVVKKAAQATTAVAGSALTLSAVSPVGTVLSNFFVQALINGVSLFNLSFFGISRRIRRRGHLGTVVNAKSGVPIPGVFVELRDEYGKFVAKMLTDRSGAFGFISGHSGRFMLRIGNPLYSPYQSKIFTINDPSSQVIAERISLEPIDQAHVDRLQSIVRLFRIRQTISLVDWPLLILGTIFALALVYHNPTTTRYLLAIFYAILWVAKAIDLARDKTSGVILDASTRQPVGLAVVQLCAITPAGTQVIRSAVTDSSGRFLFAVAKGNYQLVVARQGYQTIDKKIRGEDTSLEIALAHS